MLGSFEPSRRWLCYALGQIIISYLLKYLAQQKAILRSYYKHGLWIQANLS